MTLDPQCETCANLWRDYSSAVHMHCRLDNKLKLAELQGDIATAGLLRSELETARDVLSVAKAAFANHERVMHTTIPAL